jgi:hypothetical protein
MSSDWAGPALGAVLVVMLLSWTLLLGLTDLFGLSVGIGWNAMNSGTEIRRALTPKIGSMATGSIFLGEGEELAVDLDLRPEAGRVWVIASDRGWGPAGHHEILWHVSTRSPTRTSETVEAPHAGFYAVDGSLVSAQGDFRIEWRVTDPRTGPSVVRYVLWLFSHAWFVIPLLLVVAATIWKIMS